MKGMKPKMFTEAQVSRVIKEWGQDVYANILQVAGICSENWKLFDLVFFESYSMNTIFFCKSEIYGDCVLKIANGFQDREFTWEYNILREYNGVGYAKVYESNITEVGTKAMLIERIAPGTQLHDEKSLDKRLSVFSELFNGLHIKPKNPSIYKKYADGIKDCIGYVDKREDCKDLLFHILKAKEIYTSIAAVYNQELLLHGDLQNHNIILRNSGKYAIIDPQGRIGAHVFDVPRYILQEHYNSTPEERFDKIDYIITYLEKSLNIPNDIIKKCHYIETATFECWCASVGNYNIDRVIFAEKMMGGRSAGY